eukprot:2929192-Ditylum_brightwellii.AAC.1
METLRKSGMLRFYDGIHSDHRGIYCDIDIMHLLRGEVHNISERASRRYHTKFKKRGEKYRAD